MLLNGKVISELEERDLRELIAKEEPERKTLEYKRDLLGGRDEEKREFLADACSFANASGGFLIYGMEAEEGRPVDLPGIAGRDMDAEILRLESIIRDGIAPHIPGVGSRAVPLSNGHPALVVEIRKSWVSPHMVKYKGASRFYARNSNGKYQMDVQEIRRAFAVSETLSDKLRSFRFDRLAKIEAGESPIPLPNRPRIVVQVVPVAAFQTASAIDLQIACTSDQWRAFASRGAPFSRFNFDGILAYWHGTDHRGLSSYYVQLFRNGIVEAVDASLLGGDPDAERYIFSRHLEDLFIPLIGGILKFQHHEGIGAPVLVFFSMLGVSGYVIHRRHSMPGTTPEAIDRDALLFPEVWLNDYPVDMGSLVESLRPVFDALWNASGFPQWMTYQQCLRRLTHAK